MDYTGDGLIMLWFTFFVTANKVSDEAQMLERNKGFSPRSSRFAVVHFEQFIVELYKTVMYADIK